MTSPIIQRFAPLFLSLSVGACASLPKPDEPSAADLELESEIKSILVEGIRGQQAELRQSAFALLSASNIAAERARQGDVPVSLCEATKEVQEVPDFLALRYKGSLIAQYRLKNIIPEAVYQSLTTFNKAIDSTKGNISRVLETCDLKYGV